MRIFLFNATSVAFHQDRPTEPAGPIGQVWHLPAHHDNMSAYGGNCGAPPEGHLSRRQFLEQTNAAV